MNRLLICAVLALFAVGCGDEKVVVPPGAVLVQGVVQDVRGYCHEVRSDDGERFSVHFGQLPGFKAGDRVRLIGEIAPVQDCPGSRVLRLLSRAEPL